MTTDRTFVIVGASLAGAKAAETLREEGFDGRLVLVGSEAERPYERPPLSKDYLRGETGREKAYVHDEGFYAEHGHRAAPRPDGGRPQHVAAGGHARRRRAAARTTASCSPRAPSRAGCPIPGGELDGVLHLRSIEDADALRRRLVPRRRGRGGRGRMDRRRGRRLRPPARPRRHPRRRRLRPAGARARPRGRRGLPRRPRRPRRAAAHEHPGGGVRGPRRGRAGAHRRRSRARVRLRGRRRRRPAAHRARRPRRPRGRQRHPGRRAPADQRPRRARRRRRGQRPAPVLRPPAPGRALGQRAAPGAGRRSHHARPRGAPTTACRTSSPTSTTSAWSTPGFARTWDRVVFRGDPADPRVHRLLARRRPRRGGHERQRLGRHGRHPAPHPRARRRRRPAPRRPGSSRSSGSPPSTRAAPHEPPAGVAGRRRRDLARHALARAAGQRRLRRPDRRLRGDRRHVEPHDLRSRHHRLGPLRRPAPRRRGRRGRRDPQELFFALALDDVGRAADLLRPAYDGERRARRVRLLRMHAGPRARQGRHGLAGAGPVGPARAPQRDDQGPRHGGRHSRDRGADGARGQRQRHAPVRGRALRAGDRRLPRRARAPRDGRAARGQHRVGRLVLRLARRRQGRRAAARGLRPARPRRRRQRAARLRPLPPPLRRPPLGDAPRRRRPPPAAAVGQHRPQGPRLLRRALRGKPHRARRGQHHAPGHVARVRRPRPRRPPARGATGEAERVLRRVAAEGIDLEAIAAELEREGVDAFCRSYRELLDRIAAKTRFVVPA